MGLLAKYDEMKKQAELQQEVQDKVEYLTKVAAFAEELLDNEYKGDYSAEDVEKLASKLIELEVESQEEEEKVAELVEAGRIMARGFMDEVNNAKQ